jgi:hypothetical protein
VIVRSNLAFGPLLPFGVATSAKPCIGIKTGKGCSVPCKELTLGSVGCMAGSTHTRADFFWRLSDGVEKFFLSMDILLSKLVPLMAVKTKYLPFFHKENTCHRSLVYLVAGETFYRWRPALYLPTALLMKRMIWHELLVFYVVVANRAQLRFVYKGNKG